MADTTISSLDEVTTPSASDVLPIVSGGATVKVQAQNLRSALPVATTTEKGLLSAADKVALDAATIAVASLQNHPVNSTVASASTISIPNGADTVILTGTTNVAAIVDAIPYKSYTFYYPSGAGLQLLGVTMSAGTTLVAVYTP